MQIEIFNGELQLTDQKLLKFKQMKNKIINLFGDNKIVQNKGVKYSTLLEKFMANFKSEFSEMEYIENIFEVAIAAWNFGNISVIVEEKEFKKIIASSQEDDINTTLLFKMIDYKVTNFKEYTNFIVDYDLKETSKDPILSVITQEQETYLAAMFNEIEHQNTPDDFDENFIDRSAIILKPLQPFIDWHNSLYPDSTLDEIDVDIYLVNNKIDDLEGWLKKKYDKLFTIELYEWHTNKKDWPQKRNYKMFKQWFQVQISTEIYDLEKKPISKLE